MNLAPRERIYMADKTVCRWFDSTLPTTLLTKLEKMKAIELLKEVLRCSITKGSVYADYKAIKGKLNKRATYYLTFNKVDVPSHEADVVLLCPSGEELYLFKIEH